MPGPQAGPFKAEGKEDNPPLSKHTAWARTRGGRQGLPSMAPTQRYYSGDQIWLPDSTELLVSLQCDSVIDKAGRMSEGSGGLVTQARVFSHLSIPRQSSP